MKKTDVVQQVKLIARDYVRKGGKTNRRQQYKRMVEFAVFCRNSMQAPNIDSVGNRHVIRYYKSITHLADSTVQSHYYAIKTLFNLAGKTQAVKPKLKSERLEKSAAVVKESDDRVS